MFRVPLCPSPGAQELCRWLLPVVLGALVNKSLVWCRAVGYVSGLRDAAQHVSGVIMPIIRRSRVMQMAAVCGTWRFGLTNRWSGVELRVMCPVCGMLLNMFRAPLFPSSGAQELCRWLLPVVLGILVKLLVWCRAEGYVSGLRDAAQHVSGAIIPTIRSSRVIQMAALCGTWRFGLTNRWSGVELWVMCPVC